MKLFSLSFAHSLLKEAQLRASVQLQPHQEDALEEATDEDDEKGIILNWGLGSGKTIGSVAIAEEKGGNVLVVVPASLRENFRKQLAEAVVAKRRKAYTIISYDAFRKDPEGWVKKTNPTTLITDEMHRVRNPNPREPFEKVREQVPFMVGLTGTLINNRPEELVPLVNLVAGRKVFDTIEDFKRQHLGVQKVYPGFWGTLRGVKPGQVEVAKNTEALGRKLEPVVHRFTGDEEYRKHTPKVIEEEVRVPMDPKQEKLYNDLTKKNPTLALKIKYGLPPSKRELKQLNAFMTAARQISNTPKGYATEEEIPSPKFEAILGKIDEDRAADPNYKALIYSGFLESGVDPLVKSLNDRGIPAATFTGDLTDKKRKKLVEDFNRGKIRVLGLSPAGGEGLDLKGVKAVHIAEEHWNPVRASQAVGRGTRFKSHADLPEEERRVKVRRYFATHSPPGFWGRLFGATQDMSADEWIDQRRRDKQTLNEQFLGAIEPYGKAAMALSGAHRIAFAKAASGIGGTTYLPASPAGQPSPAATGTFGTGGPGMSGVTAPLDAVHPRPGRGKAVRPSRLSRPNEIRLPGNLQDQIQTTERMPGV